jgi:transcriptional regulator with XRE-family HTH domain
MIKQHPGESARAFEARQAYVTAGPGRSLDKLALKLGKSASLLSRWAVQWRWVESAAEWDRVQSEEAQRRAGEAYQAALDLERRLALDHGAKLLRCASAMLAQLEAQQADLRYTPASLAAIAKALTLGLDLRAHALGLAQLEMRLSGRDE